MSKQEYNTILIIGNGFDLNLGLKTSYYDFISSDIFNNLLVENNQLCMHLKNQQELNNWIDIENELKNYSNRIYINSNRKIFKGEYQQLCNSLCEYLNSLEVSCIDETSEVYKIITEELGSIESLLILNYNYTPSIDYIIHQKDLKHKTLKVHGCAKKNKIVFGVEDRAAINANDVFLKKSTCIWNDIQDVNSMLSNASTIIFLGYSLGETDHHYFEEFFRKSSFAHSERKNIFISYYKEDGKDDIFRQLDALTSNRIQGLRTYQKFKMLDLTE